MTDFRGTMTIRATSPEIRRLCNTLAEHRNVRARAEGLNTIVEMDFHDEGFNWVPVFFVDTYGAMWRIRNQSCAGAFIANLADYIGATAPETILAERVKRPRVARVMTVDELNEKQRAMKQRLARRRAQARVRRAKLALQQELEALRQGMPRG